MWWILRNLRFSGEVEMLNSQQFFCAIRAVAVLSGLLFQATCIAAVPASAEIVSITGKVETRPMANAPWTAAQAKQVLFGGNFVRTLDDSSAALLFADRSQLRLSRNSMFEVKSIGDGKTTDTNVSLLKGKSWMQSKSVPNKLKVETPSGTAGIHGTDWVMEVDDAGVTTVTVLSGEVEFSNALGSVRVNANEQAVTEPGRAPLKRLLTNSRERVQWVTAHRVAMDRYPELAGDTSFAAIRELVLAQRGADARVLLEGRIAAAQASVQSQSMLAGAWLLAADFALAAGDFEIAKTRLRDGAGRFPLDDRFPASLSRAALLTGDWDEARRLVATALDRFSDSLELALVAGELARLDGDGARAVQAFVNATRRAPQDYRAWYGLGTTYAEQENFEPARKALQRAVDLVPGATGPLAELGALETRALRLGSAQAAIDQSLNLTPDDYVAWTSRGVLLLAQGQPEAALEALLKAGVLEPRYAKAQIYAAIAWYQLGRSDAALASLAKAKVADPNDPLPYFYEAQIQRDDLNPTGAITAARAAIDRFGFLKSLGPIATDRQGNSSLGAAYALFGLEAWAKRTAAESQHPFFAGSYLFAAERSAEPFYRNSGLIQGYLTDPTLFGASPQRSTLLATPAAFVTTGLASVRTNAVSSLTPTFIANGYRVAPLPIAGFIQLDEPRFRSGDELFSATAPSVTAAVGFRPDAHWGVFLYRDEFRPRFSEIALNTASDRIVGNVVRTDAGSQWQIDPSTAIWIRAGQATEDTEVQSNVRTWTRNYRRQEGDAGVRMTVLRAGDEWTLGLESGRASKPGFAQVVGVRNREDSIDRLESGGERIYASWKGGNSDLRLQADLDYSSYRLDKSISSTLTTIATGAALALIDTPDELRQVAWSPRLGVAWKTSPGNTYRLAWQQLTRPASSVSLAPLDTVGISLDVPGLQPGGQLKRLRAQGEWEIGGASYITAFADRRDINNLHDQAGFILNPTSSLAQYDRLRQQGTVSLESAEALEASTLFAAGTIQSVGFVFEKIAGQQWSWTASYVRNWTQNALYPDVPLPHFPEHTLKFGVTWFAPHRWVLHGNMTGRSERTVDDPASKWLDPDWDLSVSATWQDAPKRSLFEIFAKGLNRKDESAALGVRAVWRF